MAIKVIEGLWEDIAGQVKLSGRHVRVMYEEGGDVTLSETKENGAKASGEAWLQQLRAFSSSHQPPAQAIDLDRDRVFEELHDDRS
jgi:hypothetical protein